MERHPELYKARVEVGRENMNDILKVRLETNAGNVQNYQESIRDVLKLRAEVELCAIDSLPKDGLVIADLREHE